VTRYVWTRRFGLWTGLCARRTENGGAKAPKRSLPLNFRPLVGGYFFFLAVFLTDLEFLVGRLDFDDFLAIVLPGVFCVGSCEMLVSPQRSPA